MSRTVSDGLFHGSFYGIHLFSNRLMMVKYTAFRLMDGNMRRYAKHKHRRRNLFLNGSIISSIQYMR